MLAAVCLEEEVVVVDGGDAAVDNGARPRVTVSRCVRCLGREEASVVPLCADDDRELRVVALLGRAEPREGLLD